MFFDLLNFGFEIFTLFDSLLDEVLLLEESSIRDIFLLLKDLK